MVVIMYTKLSKKTKAFGVPIYFIFLIGPDFIQKNRERKTTKPKTQLHTVETQKQQEADTRKALSNHCCQYIHFKRLERYMLSMTLLLVSTLP